MEVVSREENITHAVIGGGEQINFGISDDAMFMHMLSSTLYSDKILAVARETLCNAWDAHVEAGVTDKAIEVTLTREKLIIKDYGFGIPRSNIGRVYGTYGASTKKHDGKQTGGFGLGCKSPFAYVDHFQVTSCNDGTKTLYKMTKSSAELEGKPGIIPLFSVPTQETGIAVEIDILSSADYGRFDTLLKRLIANGEIFAMYNGTEANVIPFSKAVNGYAITKQRVLENRTDLCVRYGHVIYPLERHDGYANQYDKALTILSKIGGDSSRHSEEYKYALIMQAPSNAVAITPSREALSMEAKTIETVTGILDKFLAHHKANFEIECLKLVKKKVDELVAKKELGALLRRPHMSNVMANDSITNAPRFLITDTTTAARAIISKNYPGGTSFETNEMMYRLTGLINSDQSIIDKGMLQSFRREYRRTSTSVGQRHANPRKWFLRNITGPLVAAMQGTELHPARLMILGNMEQLKGWGASTEITPLDGFRCNDLMGYAPFMRNIVVMTHSKTDVATRMGRYTDGEKAFHTLYREKAGVLVYVVPRSPKKMEAARKFFIERGCNFVDLTEQVEYRAPVARAPKEARVEKPKGYVSVAGSFDGKWFDQYNLTNNDPMARVLKPLYVTTLHPRSDRSIDRRTLPGFGTVGVSTYIRELYGDVGAAVLSKVQVAKLADEGVPLLEDFLLAEIAKLFKSKAVKTVLGMSAKRVKDCVDCNNNVDDAIDLIWQNEVLVKLFKLESVVHPEEAKLLEIWEYFKRMRYQQTGVKELREIERDIPVNKKALAVGQKLAASSAIQYLDIEAIQEGIVGTDPQPAIKLFMQAVKG